MLSFLKDLLFPDRCVFCGKWGKALCSDCISRISGFKKYNNVYAFGLYEGPLKEAIWALKYRGYRGPIDDLIAAFSEEIVASLKEHIDIVVPVPEDPKRRRFFNHVFYFSRALSKLLSKPGVNELYKVKATPPQVGLSRKERKNNLKGAFIFKGGLLRKRVLLVDDVVTTGATMEACTSALVKAGAVKVEKMVIALNV